MNNIMLYDPILLRFDPVSLEEMANVRLMNRIDTKFVTSTQNIMSLLELARNHYLIQEITGNRNMPYYTKYFDTPDVRMFHDHQRGKKSRRKVRIRKYEGNQELAFIEIKDKNNKGRTKKKRIPLDYGEDISKYGDFISKYSEFTCDVLNHKIENHFYRVTLVNREMTERVTIDTGIKFHNLDTDVEISIPEIGIIEWKRDSLSENSLMKHFLRSLHINPSGFSKYVMGMAMTDPSLRCNRIKPRLRRFNKIH